MIRTLIVGYVFALRERRLCAESPVKNADWPEKQAELVLI
jgi:hypothetical protein